MVVESEHPAYGAFTALGSPLRMGDGAPAAPSPPPLLGEHTDEVLAEAGLAPEEIAALRQEGVVA
jgi:crotonobetainyl-CoA:carnitine CoA-transferase CaiB-like acyl-CoA transferase